MESFLGSALGVLEWATITTIATDVLMLLPLAAFRRTRAAAGVGLYLSSWLFGLNLWLAAVVMTLIHWGWQAVLFGLFFVGVGVLPIGVAALLWHADWSGLIGLGEWTALTFGTRVLGIRLGIKSDQSRDQQLILAV